MQAIAQEVGRLLNISIASPTFAALSGSARNMIVGRRKSHFAAIAYTAHVHPPSRT